jgi:hypothetical protein
VQDTPTLLQKETFLYSTPTRKGKNVTVEMVEQRK